jgi:hypothetical protein
MKKLVTFLLNVYYFIFGKIKKELESYLKSIILLCLIGRKFKSLPSSINNYFIATTSDFFYKISISNSRFFLEEQNNISIINHKFPEISKIIPKYNYKSLLFNRILIMRTRLLFPIVNNDESILAADLVLKSFRKYGEKKVVTINELDNVLEGLNIIKKLYNENIYQLSFTSINLLLKNNSFSIGPCHGDFHSKNILGDGINWFVIDLDCFRVSSIQEFDAVYFINQIIVDSKNISWYEALRILLQSVKSNKAYLDFVENFIDKKVINSLLLIYFLDRIGQELKYCKNMDNLPKPILTDTLIHLLGTN